MKLEIFVRGTCKEIHFSGNSFNKGVCAFLNTEFIYKSLNYEFVLGLN